MEVAIKSHRPVFLWGVVLGQHCKLPMVIALTGFAPPIFRNYSCRREFQSIQRKLQTPFRGPEHVSSPRRGFASLFSSLHQTFAFSFSLFFLWRLTGAYYLVCCQFFKNKLLFPFLKSMVNSARIFSPFVFIPFLVPWAECALMKNWW